MICIKDIELDVNLFRSIRVLAVGKKRANVRPLMSDVMFTK